MRPLPVPLEARSRRGAAWLAAGLLLLTGVAGADDSLRSLFSADEYERAGLARLSPEEQAALLHALQLRGLGQPHPALASAPAPAVEAAAPAVPAAAPAAPEKKGLWARIKDFGAEQLPAKSDKDPGEVTEVSAQMIEPFRGLAGHTLFRLDNGQIWQQRISEVYYIGKPVPNPTVILTRTRFGYRLAIPAVGKDFVVSVKRVQ